MKVDTKKAILSFETFKNGLLSSLTPERMHGLAPCLTREQVEVCSSTQHEASALEDTLRPRCSGASPKPIDAAFQDIAKITAGTRVDLTVGTPNCLDQLLPLFRAYQTHYNQFTVAGEAQTRDFLSRILRCPNEGFVILASASSQIVGFATGYVMVSGLLAERMIHLGDL